METATVLRKAIQYLGKQCELILLALQHAGQMLERCPGAEGEAVVQQQLNDIERAMVTTTDLSHAYFPPALSYVYVLRLQDECYYVGTSETLGKRLHDHFCGQGSAWTQLHRPACVVEITEGGKAEEKVKTLEYMQKQGWEKVRGYAWTQKDLKFPPRELCGAAV
jgi:predicted GIY-YIG superfamily endonuclease